MANYYATTRSNYFRVKDAEAFKAWADKRGLDWWTANERAPDDHGAGLFAIGANRGGGWPSSYYSEEADGDVEFDLVQELASHLAENQVAVLMEAGAEKTRYVVGCAIAVHANGEVVQITLDEIYALAQKKFGDEAVITKAEY